MRARQLVILLILVLTTLLSEAGLPPTTALAQQTAVSLATPAPPAERLSFDGTFEMPRLPSVSAAAEPAVPHAALASEYANWSQLVFQSARNGHDWEVYRANGDGASQVNISNHGNMDVLPRLNRGATRVVFASNRDGNYEIYVMNADGSGQTRLTFNGASDVYPTWSPDGSRIAFQSYRDGQSEIYVMNADGSGQTRITAHGDYDGEPTWSPDGKRIAFCRRSSDQYRIWVMNADGSSPQQFSDQPYSENPAWSPDGVQIAYDADGDGDGWQELWVMDASGGNQRQVYDPGYQTDAWARSWSPDGRYIAFTRISFIQQGGNWYWTYAYLDAVNAQNLGDVRRLSDNGEDWYPDWQTTDIWPPTSNMLPLPSQSPASFAVQWSGTDVGPASVAGYDVQVRDGPASVWADWQMLTSDQSAIFTGVGGHTYYFRARARDHAANLEPWSVDYQAFTTVEALAPATAVSTLAPYSRGEIAVHWVGADPGGSGIATYDVQVRDGFAGTWADWQVGTEDAQAVFSGEGGHTYYFRSRGTDRAGNVEPWPPGDGDASTTFFVWQMTGTLRDNRDTPVMSGAVSLTPEPLVTMPSDVGGNYSAYEAVVSDEYVATWGKAGYGSLPATAFSGATDTQADMILPPADNVVQNWGFENGSLGPEWLVEGAIPPGIASDRPHTGGFSATLGQPTGVFDPWVNLSNSTFHSSRPSVAVDGSGAVHVVWIEYLSQSDYVDVLYTRRARGGAWSAPINVSGGLQADQQAWFLLQLVVEADGTAHLAWPCGVPGSEDVFYNRRTPDGAWSGPVNVSRNGHRARGLNMALGIDGALHLVWEDTSANAEIMYARRTPDGVWSAVVNLSQNGGWSDNALVAAGPDGATHVVWTDQTPGNREAYYVRRSSDGTWSAPLNLSNSSGWTAPGGLAVAADGSVHVAWSDNTGGYPAIYYARRSADGAWSDPVQVADPAHGGGAVKLALGPDGSVHLVWGWSGVRYARRTPGGVWSPPEEGGSAYGCEWHELGVDSSGTVHTTCAAHDVLYLRRTAAGVWSGWINVSNTSEYSTFPRLALDATDNLHVVWMGGPQYYGNHDILYARSAGAAESGESVVSQELTVPAGVAPTLSFWYRLEGTPSSNVSWFAAQVDDGQTNTDLFTATNVCDWTHRWVDLSPWAGQAISLRFLVHQTAGKPAAGATIDEVTVGSAHPDTWARLTDSSTAMPGTQFVHTITYGNRGGVTASNGQVTLQLPPDLVFIRSDPPPSTATPTLRWDVGDLTGGAAAGAIRVTLQVAASAVRGATLTTTAAIASNTPEIEQANNTAQSTIFIGHLERLPLIMR